jgi:hypothetical protein
MVVAAVVLPALLTQLAFLSANGKTFHILFMLCYVDMFAFAMNRLDSSSDAVFPTAGRSVAHTTNCELIRSMCESKVIRHSVLQTLGRRC